MAEDTKRQDADSATDLLDPPDNADAESTTAEPDTARDSKTGSDESESSAAEENPAGSALRTRLIAGGGAVLLAAATASAVYFYVQLGEERDGVEALAAASAAACDHARDLANFDYNNLDPYFGAVLDGATGDWKSQFDGSREDLRNVYTAGQVVSQATDAQCAPLSGGTEDAEVLVVVTESVSNVATGGQPQVGQLTMKVNVDKVDGRWLVSKLSGPQLP